jgi:hypothetical protein
MRIALPAMAVSLLLASLSLPPTAAAQGGLGPCQGDVEKLCADQPESPLGLIRCLNQHREELTPECSDALRGRKRVGKERYASFVETCREDAGRLCEGVRAPLKLVHCLARNEDELTPACRDALPEREAKPAEAPDAPPAQEPPAAAVQRDDASGSHTD